MRHWIVIQRLIVTVIMISRWNVTSVKNSRVIIQLWIVTEVVFNVEFWLIYIFIRVIVSHEDVKIEQHFIIQ